MSLTRDDNAGTIVRKQVRVRLQKYSRHENLDGDERGRKRDREDEQRKAGMQNVFTSARLFIAVCCLGR